MFILCILQNFLKISKKNNLEFYIEADIFPKVLFK